MSKATARMPSFQRNRFAILSRGERRQRGEMNETEAEYSELLTADPDVHAWWFEAITLRYSHPNKGQPGTYTPDFVILMKDGTTILDDVKGSGIDNDAAKVRVKACAELFPLWKFRVAKKRAKKNGGGFAITEY